jgi:hypothetical protein
VTLLLIVLMQNFAVMDSNNTAYEPLRRAFMPEHTSEECDAEKPLVPGNEIEKKQSHAHDTSKINGVGSQKSGARVALRVFALMLSLSILAVQGRTLSVWFETRKDGSLNKINGMTMRAWAWLDSTPTWVIFAISSFATTVHLFALGSLCSIVCSTPSAEFDLSTDEDAVSKLAREQLA